MELIVSCDLMKNYEAGSPANTGKLFQVAQNGKGEPIIVSIGLDDRLYAITHDPGSSTGWRQNDITPNMENGKAGNVVTFEIYQMNSGSITLACSVSFPSNPEETNMYVSSSLLESGSAVQWDNFAQYWHIVPFQPSGSKVTKIHMGEGPDPTVPLFLVAIQKDDKDNYYRLNTDLEEYWAWVPLTISQNPSDTYDLALGKQSGLPGYYILYNTVNGESLEFTFFKNEIYSTDMSLPFDLPSGNKINSFAVLASGSDSDNVYVGGEGVYLFPDGSTECLITVVEKDKIPTVQTLLARQDNTDVTLWMVSDDKNLWMTVSPVSVQTTWQKVLPFKRGVSKIAALRNRCYDANQLFLINDENHLIHLWQDPEDTKWCEGKDIPLKDTQNIISFDCYTTHISFRDKDSGVPVTDIKLNLKSSISTYLKVNGKSHSLSGSYKDEIPLINPDEAGNITIINQVSDLSTSIFELELHADWLEKVVVEIDPATKVRNLLSEVKSGDDLRAVVLADGKKLIPDSVSKESVDKTAEAIKQLVIIANHSPQDGFQRCVADGTGDYTKPRTLVAFQRNWNGIRRNLLSTSGIENDYFWSTRFEGENVTFYEGKDTCENLEGIGNIWDGIKSIAGDVIKALESSAEELTILAHRIVDKGIEFAVKIGSEILNFIVETVEQVMSIINSLFQKIKVPFEDLMEWLGFIFDWDDIILTKKIIVNVSNQTLELAKHKVGDAEAIINNFFDGIEKAIDKLGPVPGDVNSLNLRNEGEKLRDKYSGAQDFLNSAPGNFANYHIMQSVAASPHSDVFFGSNEDTDPLTTFFSNVVFPLGEDLVKLVRTFADDICNLFTANNLTLGESLAKMSKDMLKQVIKLARTLVSGFLEVIESVLSLIKDTLNSTLNIPILSALYKSISGSDDISLLDVFALLLVVPATSFYKVITGRSLYNEGSGGLENIPYDKLFDALSHSSMKLTETPTVTKSMVIDQIVDFYRCIGSSVYLLADVITHNISNIKAETEGRLPVLEIANFLFSFIKFIFTFPMKIPKVKELKSWLPYCSWGISFWILVGNFVNVIDKTGLSKGPVAVWNLCWWILNQILGGVTIIDKLIEGPRTEILFDVATFAETWMRSSSGILNAFAALDKDKETSLIFVAISVLEGFIALIIRGGRTVYIIEQTISQNIESSGTLVSTC